MKRWKNWERNLQYLTKTDPEIYLWLRWKQQLKKRLQEILTPAFSTRSINPGFSAMSFSTMNSSTMNSSTMNFFNYEIFNHDFSTMNFSTMNISTPKFSISSFNPVLFNCKLFNHELFNVKIFWEGQKIFKNITICFDDTKQFQIWLGYFLKFCGLLRISELEPQTFNHGPFNHSAINSEVEISSPHFRKGDILSLSFNPWLST